MEQYGNKSTFNLESVLVQNIKNSLYYVKKALDLDHVHEVIDEIYEKVDNVEPWLSGNARGPSTAFCLLFRLGELDPSPPEIREMLDHKDSPYIRAIALLYLRYCCNPRDIWKWFRTYMRDSESFSPSPGNAGKSVTIAQFARDILLDQYYFETIFPRIPKTVGDEIKENLRSMGLPTTALGNAGQGGPDRRGTDDGSRRPASVKASLAVAFGQRAPNRAGTRDQGRGIGGELQLDRSRGTEFRGADRSRDPRGSRYLDRSSSPRGNHGDGRGKYRDRRGDEKFDSGRSGGGHSGYSRDRSPVHDRYAYSGDHGHSRDRGYYGDHRRRGREVNVFDDGYGCSHRDDHKRGRSRSRNRQNVDDNRVKSPRARLRSRSGGRDARDVFKERPAPPSGSYGTLHDMYH